MTAVRTLLFGIAGLLVLGMCHAWTADDVLVPFRPPMVMEEEVEDKPPAGSWNYFDPNTKVYCILSVMAVRMTFERTDFTDGVVMYDLPANETTMNGSYCDAGTPLAPLPEVLSLKFFDGDFNLKFTMNYSLDLVSGDREWYIESISLDYLLNANRFPGYSGTETTDSVTIDSPDDIGVQARVHQAFRCDSRIDQEPVESPQGVKVTITTWDFDLEAYRDRMDQRMAFPERCLVDQEISPLVPSIIGGVVLVTVITVLIIYVLQRKQRDRGYQANADADAAKQAEASS